MSPPVYRFAPSPNGHLHLGHAYSALLNERIASEAMGRFLVRIEDIDTQRCTKVLASEALEDLIWLGLQWEEPVRFQSDHMEDYRAAQESLAERDLIYPCFCSRREVAMRCAGGLVDPDGQPVYDGHCRALSNMERTMRLRDGFGPAWRLDTRRAVSVVRGNLNCERWGDVILIRRDIGTSYHVAVVVDDARQGITNVVRGRDLEASTEIHLLLQDLLGLPHPRYFHHELITGETGRKLSKSEGSKSLRALRSEGVTPKDIRRALGFA